MTLGGFDHDEGQLRNAFQPAGRPLRHRLLRRVEGRRRREAPIQPDDAAGEPAAARGGRTTTADHVRALAGKDPQALPHTEIPFRPARVIMQDLTAVPCVVDLAALREAVADLGGDPTQVNPLVPTELVVDHSVVADVAGRPDAIRLDTGIEYERNAERFEFLRWGQESFDDLTVVPPGAGIVHQVNIEHLTQVVRRHDGVAVPDTCLGTDSHTTMVNGLGVLG